MDDGATSTRRPVDAAPASARDERAEFGRSVVAGLSRRPRAIASRWLRDADGGAGPLLARIAAESVILSGAAERAALAESAPAIVRLVDAPRLVVADVGADAGRSMVLLDAARCEGVVARHAAVSAVHRLTAAVAADDARHARRLVLLLGTMLGRLELDAAAALLAGVRRVLRAGDHVLVSFDRVRDPDRVRAAHDDPGGLVSALHLGLLARINRELGGDFDLRRWRHVVTYDPRRPAMESWLLSTDRQAVRVLGRRFDVDAWEAIHTELSCCYGEAHLEHLGRASGLLEVGRWAGAQRDVGLVLYRVRP